MGSLLSYFESEPDVKQTFVPVYVPQYRPIEAEKQSVPVTESTKPITRQTVAEKIKNDPHKHLRRPQKTRRTRRPTEPSQQNIQKLTNDNIKNGIIPKINYDFSKFKI